MKLVLVLLLLLGGCNVHNLVNVKQDKTNYNIFERYNNRDICLNNKSKVSFVDDKVEAIYRMDRVLSKELKECDFEVKKYKIAFDEFDTFITKYYNALKKDNNLNKISDLANVDFKFFDDFMAKKKDISKNLKEYCSIRDKAVEMNNEHRKFYRETWGNFETIIAKQFFPREIDKNHMYYFNYKETGSDTLKTMDLYYDVSQVGNKFNNDIDVLIKEGDKRTNEIDKIIIEEEKKLFATKYKNLNINCFFNLPNSLQYNNSAEKENCIALNQTGQGAFMSNLKVMQKIKGGYLVGGLVPTQSGYVYMIPTAKNIFLKTNKKYVDGDLVKGKIFIYDGNFGYRNILGANLTIRSYLDITEEMEKNFFVLYSDFIHKDIKE
jgi:hypothetical protein